MKERGDLDKKWGILKVHEDDMVEIIKHPTLPEGEKTNKWFDKMFKKTKEWFEAEPDADL